MKMQTSGKVAIIGAGIGGLASGYYLQKVGREVDIFERTAIPGGRVQLLEKDGARVDVGTQYFHTNYVETLKILDDLGMKDQLIPIRPPVKIMREGQGFPVKHNTLRYKMIPLSSNLKFGRIILTALRNFRRLDPYFNDPLEEFEDIELAEYVLKKCDSDTLEFLVRPIISAFNLCDPEGESLAHFLRIAKQFLTSSDTCLPQGMYSFPAKLAEGLSVRYNAETLEIVTEADKVTGIKVRIGGEVKTVPTGDIICATPLKELPNLLPELTEDEKNAALSLEYSQFPLAVFFLKNRLREDYWAYVLSRIEDFKASFVSDAAFKCREMVPSGASILQAWFVGEAGPEMVDLPDEQIVERATAEIGRIVPRFSDQVASVEVVRHHTGMPRYRVGVYRQLRDLLQSASRIKGLHLVGDYYGHSTIETVVRSAQRAVSSIAASG
jgi:protoporphyrinogen oxidase